MAAPTKPPNKLKKYRGYFYCDADLDARIVAESLRRGGASHSDIVRRCIMAVLPRVQASVSPSLSEDSLSDE